MSDTVVLLLIVAGWFAVNRFILPRLGVAT